MTAHEPQDIASVAEMALARARRRAGQPVTGVAAVQDPVAVPAPRLEPARAPIPPDVPVRYRTPLAELEQTPQVVTATRWLERWQDGVRDRGLLIIGPVGRGKSAIAGALAVAAGAPVYAQFWPVGDLLAALREEMSDRGSPPMVRHRIERRDLLVLDDVGAEQATDWSVGVLSGLISSRYDQARGLIVTANLTTAQLGERLGERALSRLQEMTELIVVDGVDRRRRGGAS